MTYEEQVVDIVAKEIRQAFSDHRVEKWGDRPVVPWSDLPDERKIKWRRMARAAIEVIRS